MPDEQGPTLVCPDCGTGLSPSLLACPTCRRLLHSDDLKHLAAEAEAAEREGRLSDALSAWRSALDLLPPETRQHEGVRARIVSLSGEVDSSPGSTKDTKDAKNTKDTTEAMDAKDTRDTKDTKAGGRGAKGAAGLTGLALLLWKLKSLLLLAATKGKLILLGLTKASTFLSMFLSFGVYWAAWGWKFALGFILSMYVHEMGHILTLRRYGIQSSAPMFIPGFGALVRLKQAPQTPREDARSGLAGPLYGLGAAVVALAVFLATRSALWGAIARTGAWLNLFNLLPVWQLDGSRGMRSLSRPQRWLVAAAFGAMWYATSENTLFLLLLAATYRAFESTAPRESDQTGLAEFLWLILALSSFLFLPAAA